MQLLSKSFSELTVPELFEILKTRVAVFVVEQRCAYQEIDEIDKLSRHVALVQDGKILAYVRVIPAGLSYPEVSLGRVLTTKRGMGLGARIVKEGIKVAQTAFSATAIRIAAQAYAAGFYEKLGFQACSEPFDEDGIPHVEMIWKAKQEQQI